MGSVIILKRKLKITFINSNTEEEIVQAIADILGYYLAENYKKIVFDDKKISSYK